MALVRCTCVAQLVPGAGGNDLRLQVLDPGCGYVAHRLAADPFADPFSDPVPGPGAPLV